MGTAFLIACIIITILLIILLANSSMKKYSEMKIGEVVGKFIGDYNCFVIILFKSKVDGVEFSTTREFKIPKELYDVIKIGERRCFPF